MKPWVGVLLLVLALGAGLAFFLTRGDDAPSVAERDEHAAPAAAEPAARPQVELATEREPLVAPREAQDVGEPAAPARRDETAPFRVHGSVCDLDAVPLARASIASEDGVVLAQAAADGSFELELTRELLLIARAPDYVTVRAGHARPSATNSEIHVLVARRTKLGGRVVDEQGAPVAGATLRRELPDLLFARIPFPLDHSSAWFAGERETESDNTGRFEFLDFPEVVGALLDVDAQGFRPLSLRLDESSFARELVVQLSRPPAGAPALEGTVRHHDGAPANGATVRLGELSTTSDAFGAFRLPLSGDVPDGTLLIAMLKGFQPALRRDVAALLAVPPAEREPLRLVLGPAPLSITGRVVDAHGAPVAKWHVQLLDGTALSSNRVPPELAESIAGGDRAVHVRTDAAGRFELGGLVEREYRLLAWDEQTLVRIESEPIGAGARDVELQVPADALWPKFAGTVVGLDGRPLAGVEVALGVVLLRSDVGWSSQPGRKTTTDAEGRFAFDNVAWRQALVALSGDAILPQTLELADDIDREQFEIRIGRRVDFRIETTRKAEEQAASVEFLLADGSPAWVYTVQSSSWMSSSRVALAEGRSQVHCVVEGAYTLVFSREDGLELLRRDVALIPGDVQVVDY